MWIVLTLVGCDRVFGLVPITPPIDAAIDRACPDNYVEIPGAPHTSRYRFDSEVTIWQSAEDICELDTPAARVTHLAVFETTDEETAVITWLHAQDPTITAHVGFARDTGSDPNVFFAVTGAELEAGDPRWNMGEPNGSPPGEETITWLWEDGTGLVDAGWDTMEQVMCECDGVPVSRQFMLHP